MKIVTPTAQEKLTTQFGTAPIIVVGIGFDGNLIFYSDQTFGNIQGQIISVSDIDSVLTMYKNTAVSTVTVQLIDLDGSLYTYYQTTDLHKKIIKIYHYYIDTNFETDKILLFEGTITTPISYDLTAKTLTLTGTTKLDDIEIGFSPDNGVWRHIIPNEIESKPWPMPFGTPVNYPLTSITKIPYGTLIYGYGCPDITAFAYLNALVASISSLQYWQFYCIMCELACVWSGRGYTEQYDAMNNYSNTLEAMAQEEAEAASQNQGYTSSLASKVTENRNTSTILQNAYPGPYTEELGSFDSEPSTLEQLGTSIESEREAAQREASWGQQQAAQFISMANQWHSEQVRAAAEHAKRTQELLDRQIMLAREETYSPQDKAILIWNGKTFPQGQRIWLNIGGSLVHGHFKAEGEDAIRDAGEPDFFYVDEVVHPQTCCYFNIHCTELPCNEADVLYPTTTPGEFFNAANENQRAIWQENNGIYTAERVGYTSTVLDPNAGLQGNLPSIDPNSGLRGTLPISQLAASEFAANSHNAVQGTQAGFVWIPAGSRVRIAYADPVEYVISIVPCTVLRIVAYRTVAGARHLTEVPSEYYTISTRDYGDGLIAQVLTLARPLSTIAGAGYEDAIYATVESSIGPNIVDIIQYLINRYLPDITCDVTSFAATREYTVSRPAHFVLIDRKNILQLLAEICYQACIALWFNNKIAYMRHLQVQPSSDITITTDIIDLNSLQLYYSPTDDVITKHVIQYITTYDQPSEYTFAIRYNQTKYGTVATTQNYFIYSNRDSVLQSATYWAIRGGNTWRMLKFTVPLDTLKLDCMDAVCIYLPEIDPSLTNVIGIIEEAVYNSETFTITYVVWLPIRTGETTTYKFIFARNVPDEYDLDEYFPEPIDWVSGNGLGSPILRDLHSGKTDLPAIHTESSYESTQLQSPKYLRNRYGISADRHTGNARMMTNNVTNASPRYPAVEPGWTNANREQPTLPNTPYNTPDTWRPRPPSSSIDTQEEAGAGTIISLYSTRIVDRVTRQSTTLASFFSSIDANTRINASRPVLNAWPTLGIKAPNAKAGVFEVKTDPDDDEVYAAKLAFLKENSE